MPDLYIYIYIYIVHIYSRLVLKQGRIYLVEDVRWRHLDSTLHLYCYSIKKVIFIQNFN